MATESKTYFELITQDKEKIEASEKQLEAKRAHLQTQHDILTTQKDVADAESNLLAVKSAEPFSAIDVIDAQAELENLQTGLDALLALEKELFPSK